MATGLLRSVGRTALLVNVKVRALQIFEMRVDACAPLL